MLPFYLSEAKHNYTCATDETIHKVALVTFWGKQIEILGVLILWPVKNTPIEPKMGFSPLRVALTLSHHRNWDERQHSAKESCSHLLSVSKEVFIIPLFLLILSLPLLSYHMLLRHWNESLSIILKAVSFCCKESSAWKLAWNSQYLVFLVKWFFIPKTFNTNHYSCTEGSFP